MSRPDYIWDGSGEPPPDIAELEAALGRHRLRGRPWEQTPPVARARRGWMLVAAVAVAVLGLALLSADPGPQIDPSQTVVVTPPPPRCSEDGWAVRAQRGEVDCDRLGVGDWLETDAVTQLQLDVAEIGELDVAPDSRLRIVASGERQHRVELQRGRLHALIDAPPRLFVVDTPGGSAIDLGCEYTLVVGDDGVTTLAVELGEVLLEGRSGSVLVPYDSRAYLRPGHDPSVPHHVNAPEKLVQALERFETVGGVDPVLALVTDRDTVSLWNMIARASGEQRRRVIARLATFVPHPPGADEDRVAALDPVALARWRDDMPW